MRQAESLSDEEVGSWQGGVWQRIQFDSWALLIGSSHNEQGRNSFKEVTILLMMCYKVYLKHLMIVVILMMIFSFTLNGQAGYHEFYEHSLGTSSAGMYILGSWAIGNIAVGAYGWRNNEGDPKYFSQMNLFWNAVNLAIAGFALHGSLSTDINSLCDSAIISKHLKTEKLFLINSGLDLGYIGAGYLMRHFSNNSRTRADMLKGYGNSVMLQGSFLLVLDTVMYFILRDQRLSFPGTFHAGFQSGSLVSGIRLAF
jgi:hypothetical protein